MCEIYKTVNNMLNYKIAICQIKPLRDKKQSINLAQSYIFKAAEEGAKLVILPEIFYHPYEFKAIPELEETNKETVKILSKVAKDANVYLCTGSTVEKDNTGRFNKSHLISPNGEILLDYSKSHLFDVNFNDLKVQESSVFDKGNKFEIVATDIGKIGILICYDIRFPETARKLMLKGADLILVPAAFNHISGPAHWHALFRARAIENQVYMIAASPARDNTAKYLAYGHSLCVDPWGKVTNEAGEDETLIYPEIDRNYISEVRKKLPSQDHRRPEIY